MVAALRAARPLVTLQEDSWYSFLLEAESTPEELLRDKTRVAETCDKNTSKRNGQFFSKQARR
jgi:hypothetical protein